MYDILNDKVGSPSLIEAALSTCLKYIFANAHLLHILLALLYFVLKLFLGLWIVVLHLAVVFPAGGQLLFLAGCVVGLLHRVHLK